MTAALANDRGFYSVVGTIDADKVEILEAAAGGSAYRAPIGPGSGQIVPGAGLRQPTRASAGSADEAIAIAEARETTPPGTGPEPHPLCAPGAVPPCAIAEQSADALRLAERLGDPVQTSGRRVARRGGGLAGDVDEIVRCIEVHGSMAEQINQPIFSWGHAFVSALPAQIAGDTDRAEALANQALRDRQESG